MGGENKLPNFRIKVKGSGGRGEKASTALGSKETGKSQPLLALLEAWSFVSSELSLLKGTLSWLMRRLGVPSQETRQIHAGSGAGVRSTLHRVRVLAPLLCRARMGDPDALWALLQLLSGRVPSSNSILVFLLYPPLATAFSVALWRSCTSLPKATRGRYSLALVLFRPAEVRFTLNCMSCFSPTRPGGERRNGIVVKCITIQTRGLCVCMENKWKQKKEKAGEGGKGRQKRGRGIFYIFYLVWK